MASRAVARGVVALLLLVQVGVAMAGCLGTRTSAMAQMAGEDCVLAQLLCRVHCQNEEQAVDAAALPILAPGELNTVPVFLDASRQAPPRIQASALGIADWPPPREGPSSVVRFARLLI